MTLSELCWILTAALGLHIIEELVLDWRAWVYSVTRVRVDLGLFYAANALGVVLGFICAELAPTQPTLALAFPALLLINAVCFHISGFLRMRGRFSPGLFTAVLLFLPLGIASYRTAWRSGAISRANVLESLLLGAALMVTPMGLLKLKSLPYFQQPE